MWKIIVLCIVITGLAADMIRYDQYKVISVVPTTSFQLRLLQELKNSNQYSFWQGPSLGKEALIMVSPRMLTQFFGTLDDSDMLYKIRIDNVQKLVDNTMPNNNQSWGFDFNSYHTLEEIYSYLDVLAANFSKKCSVVVAANKTYEGREIKGVKIINGEENPGIFIEGGMHGREWISPATVMYILHELLFSNHSDVRYIADMHNWYIFPIFNPDGYAYSFTTDRLWKKTRKPSSPNCNGSDPDRNWGFHWNSTGVSKNPCAEDYPGESPFSEIEMKTMSDFIRPLHFYAYVSFHSYGQRLGFPFSYTDSHTFIQYKELYRVGTAAIDALEEVHGTTYYTGCLGEISQWGEVSGVSIDYIAAAYFKQVVFRYQLRDKLTFLLPPEQIIPTGEETLASLLTMFTEVLNSTIFTEILN